MGYSNDLRVRVIQVVEGGVAARAAARQFVIGDSTAIRWTKRWRETGSYEAKSNKGQSRSPLKKHEEWLLEPRHQLQKKACARPSRIGLTSPRRGAHGGTINPSLIQTDWFSSTKPAPQPTWLACAAALRAVNGWSAKSHMATGKRPPSSRPCAPPHSRHPVSSMDR